MHIKIIGWFAVIGLFFVMSELHAQTIEISKTFTEVSNSSVIAAYSSEFSTEIKEYGDEETGDFKFVVIRMNLEGDVAEAKKYVTLNCPTQRLEKTYKEKSNQMLFLFPYEAKTIFVDCGDGCERKVLISGKQLGSNTVYETTVKYTAKLSSDVNKNYKLIPVIYDKNAGEEVSFREHGDESIGFFPLSTDEIELEMGKVFDFKFSKKDKLYKDSIIAYKIDRNVSVIHFPHLSIVNANSEDLTVTDCQGYVYPVVKIGKQYWISENMQCTKYDTQSEKAGIVLQASKGYIDGRHSAGYNELSNSKRARLGLLYNWSAAMGYSENETKQQNGKYIGKRQGICPNGWHIPSRSEYVELVNSCGGEEVAGQHLTSSIGWYEDVGSGDNKCGFSALPSGYSNGDEVNGVGYLCYLWTCDASDEDLTFIRIIDPLETIEGTELSKDNLVGVRCVMD
ncbi:MAG: hypothetical protein MJ009_03930 [Paludibacteraceae bacterium]|nr:hypothetical protein [Paludibacteraceae bacterium]